MVAPHFLLSFEHDNCEHVHNVLVHFGPAKANLFYSKFQWCIAQAITISGGIVFYVIRKQIFSVTYVIASSCA
jgi:hypothetical protein